MTTRRQTLDKEKDDKRVNRENQNMDSIFYQPQARLHRNYKESRARRLQKMKHNNGNNNNNNNNTNNNFNANRLKRPTIQSKRMAVGGNRNNRGPIINRSSLSQKSTNGQTAKVDITNYLDPNKQKFQIRKKVMGVRYVYAGHFNSTSDPIYKKSELISRRAPDLKGHVDKIKINRRLRSKVKEWKIKQVKYGTDERKEELLNKQRPYWFEFTEGPKNIQKNEDETNNNTENVNDNENDPKNQQRVYLGAPKQDDQNYSYAIIEWQGIPNQSYGYIYPCKYIDFNLKNQLLARGEASSIDYEKRARDYLKNKEQKEKELFKSEFNALGALFGHDITGIKKKNKDKNSKDKDKTKGGKDKNEDDFDPDKGINSLKLVKDKKTGKLTFQTVLKTRQQRERLDGATLSSKTKHLLKNKYKKNKNMLSDDVIGPNISSMEDLVHNSNSNRLKSSRTRGQTDASEYGRDFSDDEDEIALGDGDFVDDNEIDNDVNNINDLYENELDDDDDDPLKQATKANAKTKIKIESVIKTQNEEDDDDDDFDDDDSENDPEFYRLQRIQQDADNITKKDYEVPIVTEKKTGEDGIDKNTDLYDDEDDLDDDDDLDDGGKGVDDDSWLQISDADDDEDDNGQTKNKSLSASILTSKKAITIKNKKRTRTDAEIGNNNNGNDKKRIRLNNGENNEKTKLEIETTKILNNVGIKGIATGSLFARLKVVLSNIDNKVLADVLKRIATRDKSGKGSIWILKGLRNKKK